MPRGKQWKPEEIVKVWRLRSEGKTQAFIASSLGRTQAAVSQELKKCENFTPKPRRGRPNKTSKKTDRRILRLASGQNLSSSTIAETVNSGLKNTKKISKWTVRRRLNNSGRFKYCRMKKILHLKKEHKIKRYEWGRSHMGWTEEWSVTIFSDEKSSI